MSDPKHDPTVIVPVIGGDSFQVGPLKSGNVANGALKLDHASVLPDTRVGIYTLAESDRFDVFKHIGDDPAKTTPYRVVARPDRFTFLFNPDGSPRGPDTLWITHLCAASPDQLRHALTLWFRDVVRMPQVPTTTVWIIWIVDAVTKGSKCP